MVKKKLLLFIAAWGLLITALMAGLMLTHAAPLSVYSSSRKVEELRRGRWTVQHILSSDCKCSEKVYQNLVRRGATGDREELVLLLKDDQHWANPLSRKGFKVEVLDLKSQVRLAKSHDDFGVPALVVFTPKGERAYVGGYSEGVLSAGGVNRENEIMSHFMLGTAARHFPIRGCAVTASYQRKIDPFAFKYKVAGETNEHSQ